MRFASHTEAHSGATHRSRLYAAAGSAMLLIVVVLAGCASSSSTSSGTSPATSQSTPATGRQVTVASSGGWMNTGVNVAPGERLTVGCSGTIRQPGAGTTNGPSGNGQLASGSSYPLAGVYAGALIGRIGSGIPFYVGAYFDHTLVAATGSGTLALRTNAPTGGSSGSFACRVSEQHFTNAPVASTLSGNAVVRIDDPQHQGFAGPYNQNVKLSAVTDGSRTLIELTSFPPLKVGPVSTQAGNDTITISAVGVFGAFGPYGPTSTLAQGNIRGLPLTVAFHNSISLAGTCTAPFTFTTGTSISPGGHFHATGTPMDTSGNVVLVGTSKFSCNALYNPTDGEDVQMTISGAFSPSPRG